MLATEHIETVCPECREGFIPETENYDFSMFRSDLRMKAICWMDSFCAKCIAKFLMRGIEPKEQSK